jgi:hypothetical protein
MGTKRITLNELRSFVRQTIDEQARKMSFLTEGSELLDSIKSDADTEKEIDSLFDMILVSNASGIESQSASLSVHGNGDDSTSDFMSKNSDKILGIRETENDKHVGKVYEIKSSEDAMMAGAPLTRDCGVFIPKYILKYILAGKTKSWNHTKSIFKKHAIYKEQKSGM